MQRYFVPSKQWSDNQVSITGKDVHHMKRVMRMQISDYIIICNQETGETGKYQIEQISEDEVLATRVEKIEEQTEVPVRVTIAQALPKGDKLDLILQKGTELGASEFLVFESKRSVVKWDQKKAVKKKERLDKIVKEASEQSHRTVIPAISITTWNDIISSATNYDTCLFAYEEEVRIEHQPLLKNKIEQMAVGQKVILLIGPEGGINQEEALQLRENGFTSIRLGPRILRTETAALYFLAALSYHFEE
ncbi:16S rRNA (uracil(1498)-N(3))-methyltransferase [Bacillaceae bacterium S4-13-56]